MHEEHGRDRRRHVRGCGFDRSRAGDNGLLLQHDQDFSGISPAHAILLEDLVTCTLLSATGEHPARQAARERGESAYRVR